MQIIDISHINILVCCHSNTSRPRIISDAGLSHHHQCSSQEFIIFYSSLCLKTEEAYSQHLSLFLLTFSKRPNKVRMHRELGFWNSFQHVKKSSPLGHVTRWKEGGLLRMEESPIFQDASKLK